MIDTHAGACGPFATMRRALNDRSPAPAGRTLASETLVAGRRPQPRLNGFQPAPA
ncbi:MAG: hypothetical protein AVDCRST_MAG71-621 [uncultured Lysobacter sp.]|uniref:Uncharacterized protein n=1 Tax=uncultured Lysobacter sp. TaxID=271060 RepID=A0A6J4KM92_9GAMM|nr:MAG: hypothetical protein AVDCRST_MAG71-621 [uncultured Lysobacter sp.]